MSARLEAARSIFEAALDQPQDQWPRLLADSCRGDDGLRREVSQRLEWHVRAGAFLERAAHSTTAGTDVLLDPTEWIGTQVGAYELISEIGRGGMAVVFLARRCDGMYERNVAVKIVGGGQGAALAARIEQERRSLAAVEHPNIARLFDAGITPSGHSYLVMENVEGEPLDRYCAARSLSIDDRLVLCRQVCDAVATAHRGLIVHRDLKPSNILVTGAGVVKLLDFGISASLLTALTPDEEQRWLTPAYASPEQRAGRSLTTATDIFSLGVVFRELLTGAPRGTSAASQAEDLRWVLGKACAAEPAERYRSVDELRDELRRVATGHPVTAAPGGTAYRAARFVGRNRLVVGLAMAAGLALVVAGVVTLWQVRRAIELAHQNRRLLYAAQIHLAQQAWDDATPGRARELLAAQRPRRGEPDLRGFEWRLLWWLLHPEGRVFQHGDEVSAVSYSPDATLVASAGLDGVVRRWRRDTGEALPPLAGHSGRIWSLDFAPDGRTIASGGSDGSIRLWEAAGGTGRLLARHTAAVRAVRFSRDGAVLVSAGADGRVCWWSLADGRLQREVADLPGQARGLAIARGWRTVAVSTDAGVIVLLDADTGSRRTIWSSRSVAMALDISPDERQLAAGIEDATVHIFDLASGRPVRTLKRTPEDQDVIYTLRFSPSAQLLAVAARGGIGIWDLSRPRFINRLIGHDGQVFGTAFSPDGTRVLSGGADGSVREWHVQASEPLPHLTHGEGGEVWDVEFAPSGRWLASTSDTGVVRIRDARSGAVVQTVAALEGEAMQRRPRVVEFSPDEALLAIGYANGQIRLCERATGATLKTLTAHRDQIRGLAFSPDGSRLASASEDRSAAIWDTTTWALVRRVSHADRVRAVRLAPDRRTLVTAGDWRTAILWDIDTGARLGELRAHTGPVNDLALSHDGRMLVTASGDRTAIAWDLATQTVVRRFKGHADRIWSAALSPDGTRLATASSDLTVRLWDTATGDELASLSGATSARRSVAFSPDGTALAAGSLDLVSLWRAPPEGAPVAAAGERRAQQN